MLEIAGMLQRVLTCYAELVDESLDEGCAFVFLFDICGRLHAGDKVWRRCSLLYSVGGMCCINSIVRREDIER